jgi:hypothetical protein
MIEEWWGRTFEGRGTVRGGQMPDNSPSTIRKLSTEDVLEFIRSEDTRSVRGLLAHMERRRREEWTARAALVVSVLALLSSLLVAVFK